MFNRKILIATTAGLISLGAFSGSVFAASVSAQANATIAAPLSVSETTQMNFGSISPDASSATTVQLDTADAVTSPDGAGLVGGTVASGAFSVSGVGTLGFTITLPANGTVSLGGPGTAMPVNNFSDSLGGVGALTAGSASFTVGADLTVGAGQTGGAYLGSYTVTVNYN